MFIDRKCNSCLLASCKTVASFVMNKDGFNGIYYSLKVLRSPVRFECCYKMLYLEIFNKIYLNRRFGNQPGRTVFQIMSLSRIQRTSTT